MVFNRLWLAGLVLFLLLGLLARQPALTVVALLALLAVGLAYLWNRYVLHAVFYRRHLDATRLFCGETLALESEVSNLKVLPLAWIRVEDELPDWRTAVDRRVLLSSGSTARTSSHLTALRPYARVVWRSALHCPYRGQFAIGPAKVRSGDLLGFFSRSASVARRDTFIVYPAVRSLDELGLRPRQVFGEVRLPRALLTDPLRTVGVRDYRPDDSPRHIHWKATARAGELQVRVLEPSTAIHLGIFLNLDAAGQEWRELDPVRFETAISVAASLAVQAARGRYTFGVYSNRLVVGSHRPLRVPPRGDPAQPLRALEGLAKLSAFALSAFPEHLRAEARAFPRGSSIVVVTATMTPALAVALEGVRAAGHRLVLVATEPIVPPPVPGMVVHRVAAAPHTRRGRGAVRQAGDAHGVRRG